MAQDKKKKVAELTFPDKFYYHPEHTWAKNEDGEFWVGISDYAQDQLGEIIFIELPRPGDIFEQGSVFGCAESTKTTSSLYMPVGGVITAVNDTLEDSPETVNNSPYEDGWLLKVLPTDAKEKKNLFSREAYVAYLEKMEATNS